MRLGWAQWDRMELCKVGIRRRIFQVIFGYTKLFRRAAKQAALLHAIGTKLLHRFPKPVATAPRSIMIGTATLTSNVKVIGNLITGL
jgi:hypothetical protein